MSYFERNIMCYKLINQCFYESNKVYGCRRIKIDLKDKYGLILSKNKISKIMKDNHMIARRPKGKYNSYKGKIGKVFVNVIHRDFKASRPLEKITTDVTEFRFPWGKVYFQCYLDMYNSEILSYEISENPSYASTWRMLEYLISRYRNKLKGTIFHSDQGWQYQYFMYVNRLKSIGAIQSMSEKGNCLDNSIMENFFGLLKKEMFYGQEYKYKSYKEFKKALENYIDWYNTKRIKLSINTSPIRYRLRQNL